MLTSLSISAQSDSTKKIKDPLFEYQIIGLDVCKLLVSPLMKNYDVFEMQYTTLYKKNIWLSGEAGFGNSEVENEFINYKSTNSFLRFGIDKTLFNPEFKTDYSNAFIGLRYGLGFVNRGSATYNMQDSIWGNQTGTIDSRKFLSHWFELNGGFRLALTKQIYMGWQVRFKSFLNPKNFELLPPYYLAGFGKADQNTAFSYNLFLGYGFGLKRKK